MKSTQSQPFLVQWKCWRQHCKRMQRWTLHNATHKVDLPLWCKRLATSFPRCFYWKLQKETDLSFKNMWYAGPFSAIRQYNCLMRSLYRSEYLVSDVICANQFLEMRSKAKKQDFRRWRIPWQHLLLSFFFKHYNKVATCKITKWCRQDISTISKSSTDSFTLK